MSDTVREFERAFADYVSAEYAIALCNGTATLHTALKALGVGEGDRVAVPPLTMASTTIAVLHAGAEPVFWEVNPDTWLFEHVGKYTREVLPVQVGLPVDLYGLHGEWWNYPTVVDAAQTLRPHEGAAFTSYSFQASKILPLGEGGMLVTDDEQLATKARQFASLGYVLDADSSTIHKDGLKRPDHPRHFGMGWNYRMSEHVAEYGLNYGSYHGGLLFEGCMNALGTERRLSAALYREALAGHDWITPQHVPDGWTHDYWCYAVALESADLWHPFVEAVERHGGERPYAAWRLTYQEPAFRHLAPDGTCPVAEGLQPRLVQFQTNSVEDAKRNAEAASKAAMEIGGVPA